MRHMNWSGAVFPRNANEPSVLIGRPISKQDSSDGYTNLCGSWWQY